MRTKLFTTVLTGLALLASVLVASPASAAVPSGPPFTVPAADLAASLTCSGDLAHAAATPVLLVPGTTLNPDVNFGWNYEKVFSAQGRPWCAVTLPGHAMGDIQIAGQYVASALRTMHTRAGGRKVSVVGFSQGGMVPRWALKYWPDTRAMVDDMISLDPSNHGTLDAYPVCAVGCAPALWQQQSGSNFLAALNKGGETFAGISYTQVYTATDEVVVPNLGPAPSSALTTGAGTISNVQVQSICPVHVSEHLSMGTQDPVGYALVMDALTHTGPAQAARISPSVCGQVIFPGIDPVTEPADFGAVVLSAAEQLATYPHVAAEPALAPYARS